MKLSLLLSPWVAVNTSIEVTGIEQDSRRVRVGDLFLAYPGTASDGRSFIDKALEQGAAAVLYAPEDGFFLEHEHCFSFPRLSELRGEIASRFYGEPSKTMNVVGITGTNGKTTIAYLLAQAYTRLNHPAVYMGTLGVGAVGAIAPIGLTTPDPVSLQAFFAEALQRGQQTACIEVSSHALAQGRVNGICFSGAVFTNLTHDHLDYHDTMDAYAEAKALLFSKSELSYAVINDDDPYAYIMKKNVPESVRIYTYGLSSNRDIYASDIVLDRHGSQFKLHSPWGEGNVKMKLIGAFNVYNVLAVLSVLGASGFSMETVIPLIQELNASPGRMEIVNEHPCVVVDYAHTPDALENALKTLQELKDQHLYVVFGCGGDRDKTKRPIMGEIASRYADQVVITSDNPRTENPLSIIESIRQGIVSSAVKEEPDRKKAIHWALENATSKDIVLIAGKGHEDYQQIGQEKHFFSDQAVVAEYFNRLSNKR